MRTLLAGFCIVVVASGQWINQPASNIPRKADGKPDLEAAAPKLADGKPDLQGIWETDPKYNNNLAADLPPDAVPMQPWAEQVLRQRRDQTVGKDDPEGYCLPPGVPRVHGVPFPQKILQYPNVIIFLYETRNTFRQVHMDGRKLPVDPQPAWMGYSVGHWDGDTLVVESSGFTDKTWLDDVGHPHTEVLRVTERFRRRNFGNLELRITIDDPKAYTTPWTVTENFSLLPGAELIEYICNENNRDIEHLVGK